MKKVILTSILLYSFQISYAQDVTGKWEGIFYTQVNPKNVRNFYFSASLKQKDKAIWGVCSTSATNDSTNQCLYSITALLSQKPTAFFDFYKEHVEDYKGITYNICDFVNKFSIHYTLQDNVSYLVGRWYSIQGKLGGLFVLERTGLQPVQNVDAYFPKLDKLVERGTKNVESDEKSFVYPDTTVARYEEQELINALKKASSK